MRRSGNDLPRKASTKQPMKSSLRAKRSNPENGATVLDCFGRFAPHNDDKYDLCISTYTLRAPRDIAHQSDRLLDHLRSNIEMRARANPAVHHGEQNAALTHFCDHLVAGDAGTIGAKEHQVGFGLLHLDTPDLRQP